jgi:hypothetical protein
MKDWRAMAKAMDLGIPPEDLEKISPVLEGLEAAFAPLRGTIPDEVEPAVTFRAEEDGL